MNLLDVVFLSSSISGLIFYCVGRIEGFKRGLDARKSNLSIIEAFKKRNSID